METEIKARVWSDEQEAIFDYFREGQEARENGWIVACAGTGKSSSIREGVRYAPEDNIVIAAFNTKNAQEMAEALPEELRGRVIAKTFGSLGNSIILNHYGRTRCKFDDTGQISRQRSDQAVDAWLNGFGRPDDPLTDWMSSKNTRYLVNEVVKWVKGTAPNTTNLSQVLDIVQRRPWDMKIAECPEEIYEECSRTFSMVVLKALQITLQQAQDPRRVFLYGYDDQVWLPVRMKWARPNIDYLIVDEYQDMNPVQLMLAGMICRGRMCLVGDPRQAIYGFRGADSVFAEKMGDHLKARKMTLTTTYRCSKAVVKWANRYCPDLRAHEDAPEGLVQNVSAAKMLQECQAGDFILSSTNAPLMLVCLQLTKMNKPALILGKKLGTQFLEIIRQLEKDRGKFKSLPDLAEALEAWDAAQREKITNIVKTEEDLAARLEAQADVIGVFSALIDSKDSVEEVKEGLITLFTNDANPHLCTVLSTVHKAKGAEADTVWLMLTTFRGQSNDRNALYVAGTRAKTTLNLVVN